MEQVLELTAYSPLILQSSYKNSISWKEKKSQLYIVFYK